jgi:hypothetical protein
LLADIPRHYELDIPKPFIGIKPFRSRLSP